MSADLTAAELVAAGLCSRACLLSQRGVSDCACPCGGRLHARMTDWRVPGSAGLRAPPRPGPDEPDLFTAGVLQHA